MTDAGDGPLVPDAFAATSALSVLGAFVGVVVPVLVPEAEAEVIWFKRNGVFGCIPWIDAVSHTRSPVACQKQVVDALRGSCDDDMNWMTLHSMWNVK